MTDAKNTVISKSTETTTVSIDNTIPARSRQSITSIDKRVHNHETKVVKFYLHKKDKNIDVQVEKSVETKTEEA